MKNADDILAAAGITVERHRGQLRMAERFARHHAGKLIYAHGIGWHVWDGARWALDRDGGATRAVIAVAKAALRELDQLEGVDRVELFQDVKRIESAAGLRGVLEIAASLQPLAIAAERLDADPYLFNVANGVLDLRTGQLRNHDPADLITKVAGCGYDPAAAGPHFGTFISEVLPDEHVRGFVARLIGYAMLGTVREHVLPIWSGVGRNGKSTLIDVVSAAFGDYALAAESDLLVDRGNAHPTGQADLLGARLAVTTETDKGRRLAAATVKRLTGGDKIRARRMRQDFFEFSPSHTLIMVTNHRPVVSGDDPAMWRRLLVVPFDVVVPEPDSQLPERLALELPAVLAWCFSGYRAYAQQGLNPPETVQQRTDAYRADSDTLGRFIADRALTTSPHAYVRARELYAAWQAWCHENGEEAGTEKSFSESLANRGFVKKDRNIGRVWLGIALTAEEANTP